jgi:hypothetical protein
MIDPRDGAPLIVDPVADEPPVSIHGGAARIDDYVDRGIQSRVQSPIAERSSQRQRMPRFRQRVKLSVT